MSKRALLLHLAPLALLTISGEALGQAPVLESPLRAASVQPEGYLTRLERANSYQETIDRLRGLDRVVLTGFPLSGDRVVTLELSRVDRLASDVVVVIDGVPAPRPDVVIFSGSVEGRPGSDVFLSFSPFGRNGWINVDGEQHLLSSGPIDGPGVDVVYEVSRLPAGLVTIEAPACGGALPVPGVDVDALLEAARQQGGNLDPAGLPCRKVRVALDSDWDLSDRRFGGNGPALAAYMVTLFSAVGEIYKRELNISLEFPFVRAWSSNVDPYVDSGGVLDRLFEFRDVWIANMGAVVRDNAHILTGREGQAGGVAWYPALCSDFSYASSGYINGSFPYPLVDNDGRNWDVMVTAHEMGHNFGAPHTHDMNPPVDLCGRGDCSQAATGTIMSYCHTCAGGMTNISLTLSSRVVNEQMLPFINSVGCNYTQEAPTIIDQPDSLSRSAGEPATFSVEASGSAPFTYQWLKDGVEIAGATGESLTIASVQAGDEGNYTARVANSCDDVLSEAATLTISGGCAADFNADGQADFFDYLDFVNAFGNNDPSADFNASGQVDFFDYLDFAAAFSVGC
ncbi:MAG: M12 family metallo-peptidase [Planctomycetota bacterium]|nr:M12 family metallo-peptidase [Planctomycetota bacterium]